MAGIEKMIQGLKDTLAVVASIQECEATQNHAEWLTGHDKAMLEIREAARATDARIEKLVLAIGELKAKN